MKLVNNDALKRLEEDGMLVILAEKTLSTVFGIKDNSMLLLTNRNGNFAADGKAWPELILEGAEIYNTYLSYANGVKINVEIVPV